MGTVVPFTTSGSARMFARAPACRWAIRPVPRTRNVTGSLVTTDLQGATLRSLREERGLKAKTLHYGRRDVRERICEKDRGTLLWRCPPRATRWCCYKKLTGRQDDAPEPKRARHAVAMVSNTHQSVLAGAVVYVGHIKHPGVAGRGSGSCWK